MIHLSFLCIDREDKQKNKSYNMSSFTVQKHNMNEEVFHGMG